MGTAKETITNCSMNITQIRPKNSCSVCGKNQVTRKFRDGLKRKRVKIAVSLNAFTVKANFALNVKSIAIACVAVKPQVHLKSV